jgi:hypothetical protein
VKKIALIAQKGGVGKTTLAVNLAVSMQASGFKTTLFDLDPQESAVIWADRRKNEFPHVEFLTERRLPDGLTCRSGTWFLHRHYRHAASRRPSGVHGCAIRRPGLDTLSAELG